MENVISNCYSEHYYPINGIIGIYKEGKDSLVGSSYGLIPKDNNRNLIYIQKPLKTDKIRFGKKYEYIFYISLTSDFFKRGIHNAEIRGFLFVRNETIKIGKNTYYVCECIPEIIDGEKIICNILEFSDRGE